MKFNIFDVVELNNGNKATILSENRNIYKVEIVNFNGEIQGIQNIREEDIRKIILKKK